MQLGRPISFRSFRVILSLIVFSTLFLTLKRTSLVHPLCSNSNLDGIIAHVMYYIYPFFLLFRTLGCLLCSTFWALMRSNRAEAGSSVGSWGTSSPAKARPRREDVSLSTWARACANRASIWSANANNDSTRRTISCCSGKGGTGVGNVLMSRTFKCGEALPPVSS